jgi:hypothetical protein
MTNTNFFGRSDPTNILTTATLSPGINQSISSGGLWKTILFNTPGSLTQGFPMLNLCTSTFIIPVDGIYKIYAIAGWRVTGVAPGNSVDIALRIVKNGQSNVPLIATRMDILLTSFTQSQSLGYTGEFLSGDTFIIQAYVISPGGGTISLLQSGDSSGGNQPGIMTFAYVNLLLPLLKAIQISNMSVIATGALSANQSIPTGVWTTIIFNVATGDGQGVPTLNTTTGIYGIAVTGFYKLMCAVTWAANSNPLVLRILRNGNASIPICNSTLNVAIGTGSFESQYLEFATPLLLGDNITFQAWQGSGGPLNIFSSIDPSGGTQLGIATFSVVNLVQIPPL